MKIYSVVVFLLIVSTSSVFAGEASKSEKLKELMQLQGLYEMIEQQKIFSQDQAKSIGSKMLEQLQNQLPGMPMSTSIEKAYQHFLVMAKPTWTTEEAVAAFGKFYGPNVTEDEIDKMISYYKSPAGQKDVQATKNAMPLWTKFFADKNNKVLEKATQAYFSELKAIAESERIKQEK